MDDQSLSELFYARAEEALQELVNKYGRLLRKIAGSILDDPRDVEECLNDSLLTIWDRLPEDRPGQLSAYVCKIVRNIALDRLDYNRAKKRSAGDVLPIDELTELLPDENLRPDASGRELGEAIGRYLRRQKPERANMFVLRYFSGNSIRDIAIKHRCTEAKVRNLLARMRGQLKEHLKKEGYYFDE